MKWLYDNWSKSTVFLAIYISAVLCMYVMHQNYALFLIWIQTPVYFLHQFEEYILPGGFGSFFNLKVLKSDTYDFPLTKTRSFWVNIPLTYIAFPVTAMLSGSFGLSIGIWAAYFSICNAITHVVMFFIYRYNPGLVVSLFVNIPVGVYTIYYFAGNHLISLEAHIISLIIGILGQVVLMIWGFAYLKPQITALRKAVK